MSQSETLTGFEQLQYHHPQWLGEHPKATLNGLLEYLVGSGFKSFAPDIKEAEALIARFGGDYPADGNLPPTPEILGYKQEIL